MRDGILWVALLCVGAMWGVVLYVFFGGVNCV